MNNFFEADAVESAPDYKTLISQGHATDGNPSLGVPATLPGAAWFDAVTQEIVNAIKAAGISPDTTKVNQLAEAIRSSASLSKAGIVQLSSAIDSLSETLAATPKAVKQAYDLATLALNIAQNFSAMPVGATIPYSGTVIPEGWLLCNWAEVSRTQFANLFSKIGTKWGAGDGETTFNVPDYNGRHVQGTTDISQVGVFLPAGLPN
ncbi:MAG: phage tail protein, partial [Succinatimonas sp.]|nr:phage tail protein [Succinatimonas sp.]